MNRDMQDVFRKWRRWMLYETRFCQERVLPPTLRQHFRACPERASRLARTQAGVATFRSVASLSAARRRRLRSGRAPPTRPLALLAVLGRAALSGRSTRCDVASRAPLGFSCHSIETYLTLPRTRLATTGCFCGLARTMSPSHRTDTVSRLFSCSSASARDLTSVTGSQLRASRLGGAPSAP